MNRNKINHWLNLILGLSFLFMLLSLFIGDPIRSISAEAAIAWEIIHSIIGMLMVIGSIIHLVLYRKRIKRMIFGAKTPNGKRTPSLATRINNALLLTLWVPCAISGIGALLAEEGSRALDGTHRLSGTILFIVVCVHVFQHRKWYAWALRLRRRNEETLPTP